MDACKEGVQTTPVRVNEAGPAEADQTARHLNELDTELTRRTQWLRARDGKCDLFFNVSAVSVLAANGSRRRTVADVQVSMFSRNLLDPSR